MINKKILLYSGIALSLSACESKMSEKIAEGYNDSTTAEYKLNAQADLDSKIDQLQNYIAKVQQLIKTVQSSLKTDDLTPFSAFDVIYQINSKIQNQIPRLQNQKINVNGNFNITTNLLSSECQSFNYKMQSDSILPLKKLTYDIQSCNTQNLFLNAMTANFDNGEISIEFNQNNLSTILPVINYKDKVTNCKFPSEESQSSAIFCTGIGFGKSDKITWIADILSDGLTTVSVKGLSKKSGKLIYDGKITIDSNGKILSANLNGPLEKE